MPAIGSLFFDTLVGDKRKEGFEQWLVSEKYLLQGGHWIDGFEEEKTEQEIELIRFAQDQAVACLKRYGKVRLFPLPLTHIHVLRAGGTKQYTKEPKVGGYAVTLGSILVDRTPSRILFLLEVFHEHIHWGSWNVVQRTTTNKLAGYRSGFSSSTRDESFSYFRDLDEALTSLLELQFFQDVLLREPRFQKEAKRFDHSLFSYEEKRAEFNELIDVLLQANQSRFNARGDVLEFFMRAKFHGHIFEVAKLIEHALGKGSFRRIGKETGHAEA